MTLMVAFKHDEPEASPQILAEEAFDLARAGQWHCDEPAFSLNTAEAVFDGELVVLPVAGCNSIDELKPIAHCPLIRYAAP